MKLEFRAVCWQKIAGKWYPHFSAVNNKFKDAEFIAQYWRDRMQHCFKSAHIECREQSELEWPCSLQPPDGELG